MNIDYIIIFVTKPTHSNRLCSHQFKDLEAQFKTLHYDA